MLLASGSALPRPWPGETPVQLKFAIFQETPVKRSAPPPLRALALLGAAILTVSTGPTGAQAADRPGDAVAQAIPQEAPQPSPQATPSVPAPSAPPVAVEAAGAPGADYLDAVRAQRKALMEQEAARHAAGDEGPPSYGPGRQREAYREEIEKQREARRDALRERQEWQDEANRWRRYWNNPYGAYLEEMHDQRQRALEAQADARYEQAMQMRDELEKQRPDPDGWPAPPLPFGIYSPYGSGWGAPWYYPY
jgi:hypothetical protein